jgi:hypothetical protein
MDYVAAYRLIVQQAYPSAGENPDLKEEQSNALLLNRLQQGKPPIPGQITELLLALKVLYEGLRGNTNLERSLVSSLYRLVQESQHWYDQGVKAGVEWPPLLEADLRRMAKGVDHIFSDRWE